MVTRYCGQWAKEVPSIEDLIGTSPFSVPKNKTEKRMTRDEETIKQWKQWAKETGLKHGGDE